MGLAKLCQGQKAISLGPEHINDFCSEIVAKILKMLGWNVPLVKEAKEVVFNHTVDKGLARFPITGVGAEQELFKTRVKVVAVVLHLSVSSC